MTAKIVEAKVTSEGIDTALVLFLAGARIHFCCPVQRALQAQIERIAVVYKFAWHLGEQDRIKATAGVPLPDEAVAFIAKFDAWARSVQHQLRLQGDDDVDAAKDVVKTPRPKPFQFSVALPDKPMKAAA